MKATKPGGMAATSNKGQGTYKGEGSHSQFTPGTAPILLGSGTSDGGFGPRHAKLFDGRSKGLN